MKLKKIITRWLMRTQQSSRILKIFFFFITAVSTLTTAVKGVLTTVQTVSVIILFIIVSVIFMYLYEKREVMLEQFREQKWRKTNFADPRLKMQFRFGKEMFKTLSLYLEGEVDLEEFDSRAEKLIEKFQKEGIERK